MFVKATNGTIVKYPYSIGQLRRDNPNVSFPKTISAETLAMYGVYEAKHLPTPNHDPQTHFVQYPPVPVYHNGAWVFPASVVELSAEQLEQRRAEAATTVRAERDTLLTASDWTQVPDAPVDQAAWRTYRQALRDVTTQSGFPYEVNWPVKPE